MIGILIRRTPDAVVGNRAMVKVISHLADYGQKKSNLATLTDADTTAARVLEGRGPL